MATLLLVFGSAALYLLAYHTYGRWLARKIFALDALRPTPAIACQDGKDFIPSDKAVVFGHHFTSIAGTGPIVGPAIAVIWGWVPALIWVLVGSIAMGAVHDFGALVMSLRAQGRTIGDTSGDLLNHRVRLLFQIIILFALWIIIAIFGLVVAIIFAYYPESVFPVWIQLPIAIGLGYYMTSRRASAKGVLLAGLGCALALYGAIWLSSTIPALQFAVVTTDAQAAAVGEGVSVLQLPFLSAVGFWTIVLLVYAYVASILPVNRLLQPRDYINAYQLILAMGLVALGVVLARPEIVAPALDLNTDKAGVPPWAPFLFITIACGACSGFHCLVSSGCSSKQLRNERDAQFVGYGSMLVEGFLAVLVIVACVAGIGLGRNGLEGADAWNASYASFTSGLGILGAFVEGAANMMDRIPGMTHTFGVGIIGVFVAAFAATTLDTATRLQRYVISEVGKTVKLPALQNRYLATGLAVGTALGLAFFDAFTNEAGIAEGFRSGGKGAFLTLWPLFGATNQLLAGLALLVLSVWLLRRGKPIWIAAIPMTFMLGMTGWALVYQLIGFAGGEGRNLFLFTVGLVIVALEVWMLAEAIAFAVRYHKKRRAGEVRLDHDEPMAA
ncbi:MAG: carbon starvation protein A [Sumerlaeia bacterium]